MNHRLIILLFTLGIVTAVVGGVVSWEWLAGPVREDSGPRLTSPATTSPVEQLRTATSSVLNALPTPAIGPPPAEGAVGVAAASPTIIAVNEATDVTVTIPIIDSRLIPGSVTLQRLDATGKVIAILGTLNDAGINADVVAGDKTFSIQRSFTEATTTPLRLRVSWALRGVVRRAVSNALILEVGRPATLPGGGAVLVPSVFSPLPSSSPARLVFSNVVIRSPLSETALRTEAFIEIRIRSVVNPNALPINQWFDEFFAGGFATPPLTRSTSAINGREAIRLTTAEIGRRVHVYVPDGPDVIEVAYGLEAPQFVNYYEMMLGSLRFAH